MSAMPPAMPEPECDPRMHSRLARVSLFKNATLSRAAQQDIAHDRACTGIDFPFTSVEASIFALALSVFSSPRPDAPLPALLAPT